SARPSAGRVGRCAQSRSVIEGAGDGRIDPVRRRCGPRDVRSRSVSTAPRVSVVIPARDAAQWLPETIASALTQTGVSMEIIVIDDGSTDATPEIAAACGDPVRVIRQPPSGVSAARNAGTSAARGEFIQYLDADDVLEPGTIAARVALLDRTGADVA